MKVRYRTLLAVAGGAAGVVLGGLAIASPLTRSHDGDRSVIVTPYGDFTAAPETMKAFQWLSDRGLTNGFRFNTAFEVTHARVALQAAEGFELPVGAFEASVVRFNADGRVTGIEHADACAADCTSHWVQDQKDPRYWYVPCVASCATTGQERTMQLDTATLEFGADCRH
jgi:hypothetical protein